MSAAGWAVAALGALALAYWLAFGVLVFSARWRKSRRRCRCGATATRLHRGERVCAKCLAQRAVFEERRRRRQRQIERHGLHVVSPPEQIVKERIRSGIAARHAIHGVHWRRM